MICFQKYPEKFYKKVHVRSKALCETQHRNLVFKIVSKYTDKLCDWSSIGYKETAFSLYIYVHPTQVHKPRETNQQNLKFLVIVLTRAGLMNHPATVPDLPGVAIPGKILATKTISVQRLPFTMFFYPLGRAKALGLFQKSCMSSKSCNIAVDVLPHFILGFHFCARESYKQLFLALGLLGL